MSDERVQGVLSDPALAWDSVRRVREPVALILLAIAAVAVLVSAWQLFGLPGSGLPTPPTAVAGTAPVAVTSPVVRTTPIPVTSPIPVNGAAAPTSVAAPTTFGWRASAVAPQFVSGAIFTLPVLSVILVAFAGGRTGRARQVVQAAVSIQAVALGLGALSWLGALSANLRHGVWFIFDAADLAAVAAALIFTVAVMRSQALRPLTVFRADDADFDDEELGGDDDAAVDEDV